MRVVLAVSLFSLALTGCAVLESGVKLGARAAPDPYRSALREIERTIEARRYDPVQGHEHRGTWYYQGRIVPADDIEYESAFVRRISAVNMHGLPTTPMKDDEERDPAREELENELLEIIRAARGTQTTEE